MAFRSEVSTAAGSAAFARATFNRAAFNRAAFGWLMTIVLALSLAGPSGSAAAAPFILVQAEIPPTGMNDADKPMPMDERMNKRFPQPVRVGDLIGLPVLDESASTLGHVREVVRTPGGRIELIVGYSRWWGWFGRPVAVPIEVVGIEGRQIVSLDMEADDYDDAPTWQPDKSGKLADDDSIRIALGRN